MSNSYKSKRQNRLLKANLQDNKPLLDCFDLLRKSRNDGK